MMHGIIISADISYQYIGYVIEIEKEVRDAVGSYYILTENNDVFFDMIQTKCVKLITEKWYNFLKPRNKVIKKWESQIELDRK